MCFGAIPWSGISSLVCGATVEDARAIGFDEGARHPAWQRELRQRGVAVITGVEQLQASRLMQRYAADGGTIYNGCRVPPAAD